MATRSTIGMRLEDGKVRAVYCHWDGYPEGVGAGLTENYNSKEKAEELISLGGFSTLMDTIEETKAGAYNTASDSPRTFDSVTDWVQNFNAGEEYYYLWNPDLKCWTYSDGEKMFLWIKTESKV